VIDLDRFRTGDPKYYESLVKTFGPLAFTVAQAHSMDIDHAEDLYEDIWTRVYAKRRSYSGAGRFDAWIRRVANNVCIGDHRARKVQREGMQRLEAYERAGGIQSGNGDPLADLEREERQVVLHRALDHLSERQKEAIQLRIFEDREPEEVARIMGIAKATVRSLIRKGIKRLRKVLEGLQR
jgi:RNA polymerase sigma-70 factor (ECF subfamily)